MKTIYLLLAALFASLFADGQTNIYLPQEYQQAYNKKTRSITGEPGENYWINHADYNINATIHPEKSVLKGTEKITYFNNSPDTLKLIMFKLKQNVFKKGAIRGRGVSPEAIHNGVKLSELFINHELVNLHGRRRTFEYGTTFGVRLNKEEFIAPGETIHLAMNWSYKIPEQQIRTGKINDSAFFVGYWFPQMAVYDDVFGWDYTPYSGSHETYNDNSNFEVALKVPGNYMVWATGDLQNSTSIYKKETLDKIEKSKKSGEVIKIISPETLSYKNHLLDKDTLSWKFKANSVPDFSFAISANYLWDACKAETNAEDNGSTWVNVVYPENASLYNTGAEVAKQSIEYFSKEFPAIPFPYNKHTSVYSLHGMGMEFPMMANDGKVYGDTSLFIDVIAHEIAHTYFPFYVNTNEKMFAWMDEGWVSIFGDEVVFKNGFDTPKAFQRMLKATWNTINDLPLMTPTDHVNIMAMSHHYYVRSRFANLALLEILEEIGAENAIKEFMLTWQGKHPIPYDFFNFMNEKAGEDLSWFWKPWYFEFTAPDIGIEEVKIQKKSTLITIINSGGMPLPVHLTIEYKDGQKEELHYSPLVWKENRTEFITEIKLKNNIASVQLGNKNIPDVNESNNSFKL